MEGQKYFKRRGNERFFFLGGVKNNTKYNKTNNNSKNFRWGKIAARGASPWLPVVSGLVPFPGI